MTATEILAQLPAEDDLDVYRRQHVLYTDYQHDAKRRSG